MGLIKSYFTDRRQYVTYGGVKSVELVQGVGVVQGSRLGPLMFDIYSNNIIVLCSEDENILYADDSCLVCMGDDLND